MTMPVEGIPDWEQRLERQDAFWSCEIIDRPVCCIALPKTPPATPYPKSDHTTLGDRWLDVDYQAELALATCRNTVYLGDSLPHAYPNLGPEVFSAFFGCELEFGEETSWSTPILTDWDSVGEVRFSRENLYFKKIIELTDALLDAGRGAFYTGITDLHPGGDAVAAFRDPYQLNYDMVERPDEVKKLVTYMTQVYKKVYDGYYDRLVAADQPISSWADIVSRKRWLIPSNDFSCMISPRMFEDVFLESIVAECQHYEASLYHLDGPDALKHLDTLLAIPELSAIQWVYGAGKGRASDWLDVYKRCQAAGKGIQVGIEVDELETIMEQLRPAGVWLSVSGVESREEGEGILTRIAEWR
jgi:hypothetical protein